MASEMVERVARAIVRSSNDAKPGEPDWRPVSAYELSVARAAIAAMREVFTEPSETVQDAALPYAEPIRAALAAQAMIDAALKED
jgi:hypothetical protein